MELRKAYSQVKEFMEASGQPTYAEPREASPKEQEFRRDLLLEEVTELLFASMLGDRLEQLDGICDTIYILMGDLLTYGLNVGDTMEDYVKRETSPGAKRDTSGNTIEILSRLLGDIYAKPVFTFEALISILKVANILGLHTAIKEGFERVHKSNMTKFCYSQEEAEATVKEYKKEGVKTTIRVEKGANQENLYIVRRESDGKVLKSINYTPVDLRDLI